MQYSPTQESEELEEHYGNLINAINSIRNHNVLVVLGDSNAHLGAKGARNAYHNKTNKNGKLLIDLPLEGNLIIINAVFQKQGGKLWTYTSDMTGIENPDGLHSDQQEMTEFN